MLNIQASFKKTILRGNNSPFMTNTFRKAMIIRSRLKVVFIKPNLTKAGYLCTKLLRKTTKDYFSKVNTKRVSDDKIFWRTIKTYFSDKGNSSNKIMISEKDCIEDHLRHLMNILSILLKL